MEQAMKAQTRNSGTALLFIEPRRKLGWVVNATPRPLYPRKRDAVPTIQEAEWAPGPFSTSVKNLAPPTGIRSPDRPARSDPP